jgi:hypothetical protein
MKTLSVLLVTFALATSALAQDAPVARTRTLTPGTPPLAIAPPDQQTGAPPQLPRTPQPAEAPQAERELAPPPERRPLPTRNVKVDVTITEQNGTAPPVKKVVSLVVADGRQSSVRSNTTAPIANGNNRDLPLNVDASVNLTPDQRVLLELRFVYASAAVMAPLAGEGRPAAVTPEEKMAASSRPGYSTLQNSLTFLLTPGTPIAAARSADPATDRTVTVEVKAEILK